MGNLLNCCSSKKETYDEDLNNELNMATKSKPGEKDDDTLTFENLQEKNSNAEKFLHKAKQLEEESDSDSNEVDDDKEMMKQIQNNIKRHFVTHIQNELKGKGVFETIDGKKQYDLTYAMLLIRSGVYWKEVRGDQMKKMARSARRYALFGTMTPGGPGVDAPDPSPEGIEKYKAIIQQMEESDQGLLNDTLSAVLTIGEIEQEPFEHTMGRFNTMNPEERFKYQKSPDSLESELSEQVRQEIGRGDRPKLDENDCYNVQKLKMKVQIEQLTDIVETKIMAKTLPAEAQPAVQAQIAQAEKVAVPMLADYMWWQTGGKIEWGDVAYQVSQMAEKKQKEGDEKFVKLQEDFDKEFKEIQSRVDTVKESPSEEKADEAKKDD